jgi:7-carboxy-7-deazaguanine synthase
MLNINESFLSMDGEISPFHQGKLTMFVRVSGCNLCCTWCDSKLAQKHSKTDRVIPSEKILKQFFTTHIKKIGVEKITITGGEPLLQENGVNALTKMALDAGLYVTIETNGSLLPKKPISHSKFGYVVDYKLPSSGQEHLMKPAFINTLTKNDVWKFVIGNWTDYKRARDMSIKMGHTLATIAFQPVYGDVHPKVLMEWMIRDSIFRPILSVQIHKTFGIQ